jgi:hypothetical protein
MAAGARPGLCLLAALAAAGAQEIPFSGPQRGEPLPPFPVLAVNGAEAGQEVDFLSRFGDAPVLLLFLHQLDRNVESLLLPVERFAQERAAAGLRTLYVALVPDKVEGERRMRLAIAEMRVFSQVAVSIEGVEGPGAYGLNRQVAVTVLFARNRKVLMNTVLIQPGMTDSIPVLTEVARHVGGRVFNRDELATARRIEFMMRSRSAPGVPAMRSMMDGEPSELASLLWGLKREAAPTGPAVDRAVNALRQWAGDDAQRRAALALRLDIIYPLGYGTPHAQAEIAQLRAELRK